MHFKYVLGIGKNKNNLMKINQNWFAQNIFSQIIHDLIYSTP